MQVIMILQRVSVGFFGMARRNSAITACLAEELTCS